MADVHARRPDWTFLTSHARVLLTVFRDPGIRLREIAFTCGVTERTVLGIVSDLEDAGYLARETCEDDGRRNHYAVVPDALFRHPAEAGHEISGLLTLLAEPPAAASRRSP